MKYFKYKFKKLTSQSHQVFLIIGSLFIFFVILIVDIKHKYNSFTNLQTNRKLFSSEEKQKIEDICQKADKHLILLYQSDSFFYINDNSTLAKSTSYLQKYLESNNKEHLKNYIFSFYAEIILVILDIGLIVIWITLCCYVSNENYMQCLLKRRNANKIKTICFWISKAAYIATICLNIIAIYYFSLIFQDINNSFCSLFKMSYHTYYGEENFYEIKPKWAGVNELKNILKKTKNQIRFLSEQNKEIKNKINEINNNDFFSTSDTNFINSHINRICDLSSFNVPNPNPLDDREIYEFLYCYDLLKLAKQEYDELYSPHILELKEIYNILIAIKKDTESIESSLKQAINKLDSFIKIIKDMEIEYFNKSVYIFETVISGTLVYIIYVFFIFIFLIEIFGLVSMIFLNCCFSLYCNKAYNVIWNFQFFSIMIIILIIAFISIIRIITSDLAVILKYNYNNNVIKYDNTNYDIEPISICIIGDGELINYLDLDEGAKLLSHFYSKINIINNNLKYFKNYKIISEKNETKNYFGELEQNPFLAKFLLKQNDNTTYAEEILENSLNKYTTNKLYQNCGDNQCYANYFFVYDKSFCKDNYSFIQDNEIDNNYIDGQQCMLLKDFPDITNYFKSITTKNIENILGYNFYLDDLINNFKHRYYDNLGFERSYLSLLQSSKSYLDNEIGQESKNLLNNILDIYEIFSKKMNILYGLYQNILESNSQDLFSAFNCKYLKRDFYIFIDQIETNLNKSLSKILIICVHMAIFSFASIISGILAIKIKKKSSIYLISKKKKEEDIFSEKVKKDIFNEKMKKDIFHEKYFFDENCKSSTNEKFEIKKLKKQKHVIDIKLEKNNN